MGRKKKLQTNGEKKEVKRHIGGRKKVTDK